ncbi:copper transporter [Cellulomonas alba]|uniref:Copper transporter n=1 Tax=Cellulomonas alba TaxID=3053467 RepID=A0ABT7SJZ1_9CELL|nr:copper transporter [Cellulomonas alba]MDM7856506.1 copper transporter [Cellulomonas alba]
MIDFRYHVVSLISVFLALAVGIALGAGPLKETIGDTLTGQVQQLRSEKDDLRTQLDGANGDLADATTYIDATAGRMLPGSLPGRRVAVVLLGDVPAKQHGAIDDRLGQAGATVSAEVTLGASWTDPGQRSYRQALVSQMLPHLQIAPDAAASAEEQLATALVEGLVQSDPADPDKLSDDAHDVLDILSSKSAGTPLIAVKKEVAAPADAVVVIAVPTEASTGQTQASPAPSTETVAAQLAVVVAAQRYSTGAVLADGPRGSDSLTDAVLSDDTLSDTVTTVSSTDEVPGQVSVPLALAARIAAVNGHYGFGSDETPLPPPAELQPINRVPSSDQGVTVPPTSKPTPTHGSKG